MKQVRQMIQLNEDYALSADSMNILLHQRKVNQREGTKGYGDEYLAWNTRLELFYFTNNVKFAEKINSVELARKMKDCEFLKDSKYKCDIYKVVQSLEYVEGVFNEN